MVFLSRAISFNLCHSQVSHRKIFHIPSAADCFVAAVVAAKSIGEQLSFEPAPNEPNSRQFRASKFIVQNSK